MRLIDADELNERFESSCTTECAICPYSDDNCGLVHEADTVNAIVIPEGATNGDVIKALFPDCRESNIAYDDGIAYTYVQIRGTRIRVTCDWWNAPYKAESEE